jgi:DNA-binding IclR family transcriptional regulator
MELSPIEQPQKYRIKSIDKAISILELMALEGRDLTLTDIGEHLGMGKGTVHRFLNTLKGRKFVQQDAETKKYGFGVRAFELGKAIRQETFLKNIMLPKLKELSARCRESINGAVLDYDEILYIVHLESEETLRFHTQEGSRLPATCTALGKVLLSSLPEEVLDRMYSQENEFKVLTKNSIRSREKLKRVVAEVRKKDLAYDREEAFLGVCCMAAPIRNFREDIIAAISISMPTIRMTPEKKKEYSIILRETAEQISKEF